MKYKEIETGVIYTQTGRTEKKKVLGKEFTLMQCNASDGKCYLVPVEKFENKNYFEKIK